MSTEILRDAAKRLRGVGEVATPGPWRPDQCRHEDGFTHTTVSASMSQIADLEESFADKADAAWIALANPLLGPVLADLLNEMADHAVVAPADGTCNEAALAVARIVLREDA